MPYLTRWDPFHTRNFPTVNDLLQDLFKPLEVENGKGWRPQVDVKETPEAYLLVAELPGIDPGQVEISIKGDTLSLKGEKTSEEKSEDDSWRLVERSYGTFSRSFTFTQPIDVESVSAQAKDGLLIIEVKKAPVAQPKKIEVKVEE